MGHPKNQTRYRKPGQRGSRKSAMERRLRILNYLIKEGHERYNAPEWAHREKVNTGTIYADVRWLRENAYLEQVDTTELSITLPQGLLVGIAESRRKAQETKNNRDAQGWWKVHSDLNNQLLKNLQFFGLVRQDAVEADIEETEIPEEIKASLIRAYHEELGVEE